MTPAPQERPSLLTPRLSEDKKKELRELNARLENYTRRVREIYQSNLDLQSELKGAKNFNLNDMDRRYYEDKMSQLRKSLEDTKKDKERTISEISRKDEEISALHNQLRSLNNKSKDEEIKRLSIEKSLEMINEKIKSNEELLIKEKDVYARKLREYDHNNMSLTNKLNEEFERLLNEEKQYLKAALEKDKEDLRIRYEIHVSDLETKSEEAEVELTNKRIEVAALKEELNKSILEHRKLVAEGKDKDNQISRAHESSFGNVGQLEKAIANRQEEINRLNKILLEKTIEIQNLIAMNAALESEIKTVQRLLEREETVLGIPAYLEESRAKRLKMEESSFKEPQQQPFALPPQDFDYNAPEKSVSSSANEQPLAPTVIKSGSVIIEEINFEDEYLRIANTSDRDILLDKWWIQAGAPETLPKRYKFGPGNVIKPGEYFDVRVQFTEENRLDLDRVLSFNSYMTKPGAYIQIFDHNDQLISHVALKEASQAQGERLGERICCVQ